MTVARAQDLDVHETEHVEFWGAMRIVADHELGEARRQEEIDRARVRGEALAPHLVSREAGWHASIDADVSVMLAGAQSSPHVSRLDSLRHFQLVVCLCVHCDTVRCYLVGSI